MKYRAAVLHQLDTPLSIESVELGALKPTDVLVRVRASGLCHTDLEVIQVSLAYPLPIVLGHEGAGIVERVGAAVGVGAVGLNVLQGAQLEQAQTIIAIDRDPARLDMARMFGATHAILADSDDVIGQVKALTAGRGADYMFECAGSEASLQLGLEIVRRGGDAVILGKTNVSQKVSLRFGSLMGEKRIVRSSYGGARPRRDFPWLARLYLDGKLKLDELITQRLPLERINEGTHRCADHQWPRLRHGRRRLMRRRVRP